MKNILKTTRRWIEVWEEDSTLDRVFIESVLNAWWMEKESGYDQCAGDGGETNNCK